MKKLIIFCALFFSATLYAQYNMSTVYSNHNDLNASRYEPSELMLDKSVQIGMNYYLWTGNTLLNYALIKSISKTGQLNQEFIQKIAEADGGNALFGVGQDWQIGGIAFQLKKKYDFSISVVDKFGMNFRLSNNLLKLAMQGNKQFAGQKVSLSPTSLNVNYCREYVVGTALPIIGDPKDNEGSFALRGGLRAKYIQGIAAIFMPESNVEMETEINGKYIKMNFDYNIQTSGIDSTFSLGNFNGSGFGVDFGATAYIGDKLEVNISVLDLGSVSFTNNTKTYAKKANILYEGLVISQLFGDQRLKDSLTYIFKPNETTGEKFSMPLGGKIILQAELKTPRTNKDGETFDSNGLFFTYIQGLNNMPGTTTRPYVAVAYNHDFGKRFDLGLSLGYGGYNNLTGGIFTSINIANTCKIGFGADNLIPLVISSLGTGIDLSANFSLSF